MTSTFYTLVKHIPGMKLNFCRQLEGYTCRARVVVEGSWRGGGLAGCLAKFYESLLVELLETFL